MGELGQGLAKGFVKQQLLGGVGDVIFAADDVADGHVGVVDHHHEVVEGVADAVGGGPPGDHHVAAQVGSAPFHRAPHQVVPADDALVVDAETDHRLAALGAESLLLLRGEGAVAIVIAGGAVFGLLALPHLGELRFGGVAAIGVARLEQAGDRGVVEIHPGALDDRFAVPVEAEPVEPFEDVGGVFGLGALAVGVFDAQQELTAVPPGE